jgi:dipeptidyl aminopeptidase/acylaminoacyl peptidase
MTAPTRRSLLTAAGAISLPAPAWAQGAAPHTLADLVREPEIRGAALSPDGSKIAVLRVEPGPNAGAGASVVLLAVADTPKRLRTLKLPALVGLSLSWANDRRLLVTLAHPRIVVGAGFVAAGVSTQVVSVAADGSSVVPLFDEQPRRRRSLRALRAAFGPGATVVDLTPNETDTVLMSALSEGRLDLFRVNVETGTATLVEKGGRDTAAWHAHAGVPMLRLDLRRRGEMVRIFARAPGETQWSVLGDTPLRELSSDEFRYLGPTAEAGVIYVAARNGGPTTAVWRYDLRTRKFRDMIFRHPEFDLDASAFDMSGALFAARYVEDRYGWKLADASLGRHLRALNAFFDQEANIDFAGVSADRRRLLLEVSSPREPGKLFLYDLDRTKVEPLGESRPWLSRERLAPVETVRPRMRDGAVIRAYLTTPPGAGRPAPLVVVPHGGPEIRDRVDFDLWTQALAAQGWLVVQPQFRGSGGFGQAFAEAGHRQWGGRMSQDLEDTVAHLVAAGRADSRRVAIFGWSYGGYAALMGLVATPDLYVGAVAGAADSDLGEFLTELRREEGADSPEYGFWAKRIGDLKTDAAAIAAASPRRRVAEIKKPLLLLHGDADQVVSVEQSRRMAAALKQAGKTHRYVETAGEGHSGWSPGNMRQALEATIDFLKPLLA